VVQTGTIAAVAVAFANFTGVLIPGIDAKNYLIGPHRLPLFLNGYAISLSTAQLLAVAMIGVLTLTNMRGLKTGKFIQNTFTFTKTAALIGLIVVGLLLGWNHASAAYTSSWWSPWANGWNPQGAQPGLALAGGLALAIILGRAMTGPLFAQSAWNNVTFTAGEVENPGRNLPLSLLIGCGVVVGLYLLANLAYVVTLPLVGIQKADQGRVASATMQAIFGPKGAIIMAVAIMISTFGCNNGLILAGARVYYAMARDGLFFKGISKLNRQHVPAIALIAQGIWACLLTLPRTVIADPKTGAITYGNVYTQLLEYLIPADLIFYALMVGAMLIMRRKAPEMTRPYRTWGYPVVPIIYIAMAVAVIVDLAYLAPYTAGIGSLLVLTGIPAYLMWRRSASTNAESLGSDVATQEVA
jgi:APA family basic amino acid/polyamine antiporter